MILKGRGRWPKGENCARALLTDIEAKMIRERYFNEGFGFESLMSDHNITRHNLYCLLIGRSYRFAGGPTKPNLGKLLTPDTIAAISTKLLSRVPQKDIALEYGVSRASVCRINRGLSYGLSALNVPRVRVGKYRHLLGDMIHLRNDGLTNRAIAAKLGVPTGGTIGWYLNQYASIPQASSQTTHPHTE
jgi:hypothetical protein